MAAGWIEQVTGSLEQKKRYRRYKARTKQLPVTYRTAVDALDRYLMYTGSITDSIADGDTLVSILEDLTDLFEQSAANGTLIREIVGDDPEQFAETFLQNYSGGRWVTGDQWFNTERERLTNAIDRAAGEGTGTEDEAV